MKVNHYRGINVKGECPLWDSNPQPYTLVCVACGYTLESDSSGLVLPASSALVKWLSSGTCAQGPRGCLFRSGVIQTIALCFVSS